MDNEDKFLHNLRKTEKSQHQIPSHNTWERIHKKMESKKSKRFFNKSFYWQGIAASFLLICFVSVIYYFFNNSLNKHEITQTVSNGAEVKSASQEIKTEDIARKAANESARKSETKETSKLKETKKELIPTPIASDTRFKAKSEELAINDNNHSERAIKNEAPVELNQKVMSKPSPAAAQSKPEVNSDADLIQSFGFKLLPDKAAGLWAGKMNNANYAASLKKSGESWILTGQHINNKTNAQKININIDNLTIQTLEGVKTYIYKNTTGHEARFEVNTNSNDYVLISYVNDKLEIFQSVGNTIKQMNKVTANQWKLIKSYE